MRARLVALLSIAASLVAASPSLAAFAFTFQNVGDMQVNTTRTIKVFLTQTGGSTNLTTPGLSEGDTGIRFSTTGGATISITPPAGGTSPDVMPNSDFIDLMRVDGPGVIAFSPKGSLTKLFALVLTKDNAPFVSTTSPTSLGQGGNANTLWIANFTITAGSTTGTVTLDADLRNLTGATNNIVDGANGGGALGTVLDPMVSAGMATFNITPIPEPASMILVGMAATGFGGCIWRRRKNAKATAAAAV